MNKHFYHTLFLCLTLFLLGFLLWNPAQPAKAVQLTGTPFYLPLISKPPATPTPILPPPMQLKDCNENGTNPYRFLTEETYENGDSVFMAGKLHGFSPALIVNLNRKILDETFHIRTSGSGSQICLNMSAVSWIYKNPNLPYAKDDEKGLTDENIRKRIDWVNQDQNPYLKLDGSRPSGMFFVGTVPVAAAKVAGAAKIGTSSVMPKAAVIKIDQNTRIGAVMNYFDNAVTTGVLLGRMQQMLDLQLANLDTVDIADGEMQSFPQTYSDIYSKVHLTWVRSGFQSAITSIPVENTVDFIVDKDFQTLDRGWIISREVIPNHVGIEMTYEQSILIAENLVGLLDRVTDDTALEDELRKILDEVDNSDTQPPYPPEGGDGGDAKCFEPITKRVLSLAERYALRVVRENNTEHFPASSIESMKDFLTAILVKQRVFADEYIKFPGTAYSRGQLTLTSELGSIHISAMCLILPSKAPFYQFASNGGCSSQGGFSSDQHCAADHVKFPVEGTARITYP